MSVYTVVKHEQASRFLKQYAVGQLLDIRGINEGIENTVYFVLTADGEYVLTLFEEQQEQELLYYLQLIDHLAQTNTVPTPVLLLNKQRQYLNNLCGKPAILVECIAGTTLSKVAVKHCQAVGAALAKLHQAAADFPQQQSNKRGLDWMVAISDKLLPLLPDEEAALLRDEISYQGEHRTSHLTQGTIHADLFRDNVLFYKDQLSGIIDFYYACSDALLYDLAIVVNDWCTKENGQLDQARYQAVIEAYNSVRSVGIEERQHWRRLLRLAALRFWLSRLEDHYVPRRRHRLAIKNPSTFKLILIHHRQHTADC